MTTVSLVSSLMTGATCLIAYAWPCHILPNVKLYRQSFRPCLAGSREPLATASRTLRHVHTLVRERAWSVVLASSTRRIIAGWITDGTDNSESAGLRPHPSPSSLIIHPSLLTPPFRRAACRLQRRRSRPRYRWADYPDNRAAARHRSTAMR